MKIENEMELPKPTFFMCNLFYDLTCTTYQDYVLLFSSYSCFESKQVTFMEEMKAILILCIFVLFNVTLHVNCKQINVVLFKKLL